MICMRYIINEKIKHYFFRQGYVESVYSINKIFKKLL